MFKAIKNFIAGFRSCQHEDTRKVSCPYTLRTYVTCNKCEERIAAYDTDGNRL
jgi:hypothetical protein